MKKAMRARGWILRSIAVMLVLLLASIQAIGISNPVAAQESARIEITNIDAGTGLPAPFTRFQITSENGTVYGPLETDLNGYVAFSVTVLPEGTRFTVEEETPPACAPAPEPRTTEPLLPGETISLQFTTYDQPDCGLGTIALYAMVCPVGFSGPVDDYGPWRDGCTDTNAGIPFTIASVATGESWSPVSGAYGIPGRAPLVGLPVGDYSFQQDEGIPAAVFCLVYDTANYATSAQPSDVLPIAMQNGIGTISLNGNRVSCDLFTVPGSDGNIRPIIDDEPAAGAALDIHLSACPPNYAGENSIYDDCHGNGIAGQPVRVNSDSGFAGTISTTAPVSPGPGIASFADLSAGRYTITTDMPAGADVFVYCTDASDEQIPASFDDATQSLTLEIVDGAAITCDWYELPAAVQPASGNSSIEAHVLRCPDGISNETNLYDACHNVGLADILISASGPNGFSAAQSTSLPTDPGPGVALFADLVGGTYTIEQQLIDPSWSSIMYCSLANADDAVPFTRIDQTTISFDLPADTGVVCDFYNLPPADLATTLQVTNYRCPGNMVADDTWTRDDFLAVCEPSSGATQLTLTPDGGEGVTRTTGSAGIGTVLFEGLPSGVFGLHSSIPGDFNTPYLFCGPENGSLSAVNVAIDIDASLGPWICQLFNDGENASGYSDTLTITSFLCPPGTTSNYADRCDGSPLAGGRFLLDRQGYPMLASPSGDDATTIFTDLVMGDYRLISQPPSDANIAVYVVSCEAGGDQFAFDYDDADGMSIAFRMPGGVDVDCAWYNIPPAKPVVFPATSTGSITVHKFLCQGKAVTSYNWDIDCKPQTAPAGFSLQTGDGRPIAAGSTDTRGLLRYTQLVDGVYRLDETTGNWCHAEADRVDVAGNVLVANGGNTDVFIYNCSVGNVGRLPSTGVGQERAGSTAGFEERQYWQLIVAAVATLALAFGVRYGLQHMALHAKPESEAAIIERGERDI